MNKKKLLTAVLAIVLVATMLIGGTVAYFHDTTETVKNTFTMGNVGFNSDSALDEAKVGEDGKKLTGADAERVTENDYSSTKMVPGYVYDKDPTIHMAADSEDAWVFLDVTINKYASLFWAMAADASADTDIEFNIYGADEKVKTAFLNQSQVFSATAFVTYLSANPEVAQAIVDKWFVGIEHSKWEVIGFLASTDGQKLTLRLGYKEVVEGGDDVCFMTGFGMPDSLTQEMIDAGKTDGKMQNTFNPNGAVLNMDFVAYAIQASGFDTVSEAADAMFPGVTYLGEN